MEIAVKLAKEIKDICNYGDLLSSGCGNPVESINLKNMEKREKMINDLVEIKSIISNIMAMVCTNIDIAQNAHEKDIAAIDQTLSRIKKCDDNPWVSVCRKKGKQVCEAAAVSKYTRVKITNALDISAIKVPTFDYVKKDGDIYYVESAKHFAFILGGKLFHGNIGLVYTDERSPEKIKNCKYTNHCVKQNSCNYYHDPFTFHGSTDKRNFIASSWLYSPESGNRARSRRFGSVNNLDKDIVDMSKEEITRFYDQSTHDLLCSLLLHQICQSQ